MLLLCCKCSSLVYSFLTCMFYGGAQKGKSDAVRNTMWSWLCKVEQMFGHALQPPPRPQFVVKYDLPFRTDLLTSQLLLFGNHVLWNISDSFSQSPSLSFSRQRICGQCIVCKWSGGCCGTRMRLEVVGGQCVVMATKFLIQSGLGRSQCSM